MFLQQLTNSYIIGNKIIIEYKGWIFIKSSYIKPYNQNMYLFSILIMPH